MYAGSSRPVSLLSVASTVATTTLALMPMSASFGAVGNVARVFR